MNSLIRSIRLVAIVVMIITSANAISDTPYIPTKQELAEGQVEIIAGEDRTVYEYRVNGQLLAIKIVPKVGAVYYMVPADGGAHFENLDHKKKLYPQWVIAEF